MSHHHHARHASDAFSDDVLGESSSPFDFGDDDDAAAEQWASSGSTSSFSFLNEAETERRVREGQLTLTRSRRAGTATTQPSRVEEEEYDEEIQRQPGSPSPSLRKGGGGGNRGRDDDTTVLSFITFTAGGAQAGAARGGGGGGRGRGGGGGGKGRGGGNNNNNGEPMEEAEGGAMPAAAPPPPDRPVDTFKHVPVTHPRELERRQRELAEFEREGCLSAEYKCQCCWKGNDGMTQDTPEALQRVYALEQRYFLRVTDDHIFRMSADAWNKVLRVKKAMRGGAAASAAVKPMTAAQWKYHELKHNKSNARRALQQDIDRLELSIDHIWGGGVFEETYRNEEPTGEISVSGRNAELMLKLMTKKAELLKLREGLAVANARRTWGSPVALGAPSSLDGGGGGGDGKPRTSPKHIGGGGGSGGGVNYGPPAGGAGSQGFSSL